MKISKKCQYALRAIFELALHSIGEPVKIREIAGSQGISLRFMEVILNELKHGGFVESRRGNEGGYMLARAPESMTVSEVMEYIQGPISVVSDLAEDNRKKVFFGDEAFNDLWVQIGNAMSDVCERRTFADLVEFERSRRKSTVSNYCI